MLKLKIICKYFIIAVIVICISLGPNSIFVYTIGFSLDCIILEGSIQLDFGLTTSRYKKSMFKEMLLDVDIFKFSWD